jgi:hypothetical protein
MPELRQVDTDPDRFIRLRDGTIYGYTSMLAKRRDATIVDGYTAAQWFKSQGVENEITARFDVTAALDPRPPARPAPRKASEKPNRNVVKEEQKAAREAKLAERAMKLRRMKEAGKPEPEQALETPTEDDEEPELNFQDPLSKAVEDLLDDKNGR